jgi:hypothetical protein
MTCTLSLKSTAPGASTEVLGHREQLLGGVVEEVGLASAGRTQQQFKGFVFSLASPFERKHGRLKEALNGGAHRRKPRPCPHRSSQHDVAAAVLSSR